MANKDITDKLGIGSKTIGSLKNEIYNSFQNNLNFATYSAMAILLDYDIERANVGNLAFDLGIGLGMQTAIHKKSIPITTELILMGAIFYPLYLGDYHGDPKTQLINCGINILQNLASIGGGYFVGSRGVRILIDRIINKENKEPIKKEAPKFLLQNILTCTPTEYCESKGKRLEDYILKEVHVGNLNSEILDSEIVREFGYTIPEISDNVEIIVGYEQEITVIPKDDKKTEVLQYARGIAMIPKENEKDDTTKKDEVIIENKNYHWPPQIPEIKR